MSNKSISNQQQNDIEISAVNEIQLQEADNAEELEKQIQRNNISNISLADADIHMFGNRTILAEITQLLAYVRNAIKNNASTEINVIIGKSNDTVANAEFTFDVNRCQVPDLVVQSEAFIN